jgi:hypothetical protein
MNASLERIRLHMACMVKRPNHVWFHLCGIGREFKPSKGNSPGNSAL